MEKNHIKTQLKKIESLIPKASSKFEFIYLLGMKEALQPLRYLLQLQPQKVELIGEVSPEAFEALRDYHRKTSSEMGKYINSYPYPQRY